MADAATFQIDIEATSLGLDASAAQLTALTAKIQQADVAATKWDTVVAATSKRLEEASAAAKIASDAHSVAAKRYGELERAADAAAKKVEKAAAAGKDTAALQAAADTAAAAMREQAKVVDELGAKSRAAAADEMKLAESLKVLRKEQSAAAQAKPGVAFKVDAEAAAAAAEKKSAAVKAAAEADRASAKSAEDLAKKTKLVAAGAFAAVAGLAAFAVASNPAAMMRLALISQRLQYSFQQLFRGIKLDGFLSAVQRFAALFEQTNSSGKALKLLIETIFQPLFDAVTKIEPYAAEMFKGLVYGALKVTIAVLSVRNAIFKALSPETRAAIKGIVDKVATLENAFKVGEVAAAALAVVLGYVAISMLSVVASAALAAAPFVLIGVALYELIANWEDVSAWIENWWDNFIDHPKDAVAAMLEGIVKGIKDGAKWVYDAMTDLADGAVGAFKDTLGIKSPSKVFALQGRYTTEGYVEGIEDGSPRVQSALESMVSPADVRVAGGTPSIVSSATTSSTASRVFHVDHLEIGNSPVARETWREFRKLLVEEFEFDALTIGGGEVPA